MRSLNEHQPAAGYRNHFDKETETRHLLSSDVEHIEAIGPARTKP
jgi:hypothetical protein